MSDSNRDTDGASGAPDWTFDEFKAAMRLWLEDEAAPAYFSANDLANDGLPRMKHLGPWLAELAKLRWIARPTARLEGLEGVFYAVESNIGTNTSLVTVWENLLRPSGGESSESRRGRDKVS